MLKLLPMGVEDAACLLPLLLSVEQGNKETGEAEEGAAGEGAHAPETAETVGEADTAVLFVGCAAAEELVAGGGVAWRE